MKFKYKYSIFFWIGLWVVQSVLMGDESGVKFYFLKNIAIVGLQFTVVCINYKCLFPLFFEKKKYFSYVLLSALLVYLTFTLSFPIMDMIFGFAYPKFIAQTSLIFVTDFWIILSGSSFYSLALVCSLVYFLLRKNQENEDVTIELKKELRANTKRFLIIKEGHKFHKISIEDVFFVRGLKEYVVWHTKSKNIIELQSLNNIENEHFDKGLLRIHKSYIVNMQQVSSFERNHLIVQNEKIPVGRTYIKKLKNYIEAKAIMNF